MAKVAPVEKVSECVRECVCVCYIEITSDRNKGVLVRSLFKRGSSGV